jgi:hypothetical protein
MTRIYSIAQLIALPYTPPQLVQLTADVGAALAASASCPPRRVACTTR